MPCIMSPTTLTLSEIARMLGVRQHRLIHLCEKGVVSPDIADAKGRGSSRRFSRRNLLEFAIGLQLRAAMIPVTVIAAVTHVLRVFERTVSRQVPGFSLPDALQRQPAPDLRIVLSDGQYLYFTLTSASEKPKVFGGIDVRELSSSKVRVGRLRERKTAERKGFGGPEGSRHSRIEVSVTQIARDLSGTG